MGEVYRARDPRLGRDVAMQGPPALFAADADRSAPVQARGAGPRVPEPSEHRRDLRPRRTRAACQALVLGAARRPDAGGSHAQAPCRADKALPIARQIAEALATAHERGIVHRDLKPENIMLRHPVAAPLDFGLAKMRRERVAAERRARSADDTVDATAIGVLMGTVHRTTWLPSRRAARAGRSSRRHLCVRFRRVPDADRPAGVPARLEPGEPDFGDPRARAARAAEGPRRSAPTARTGPAALSRQECRGAMAVRTDLHRESMWAAESLGQIPFLRRTPHFARRRCGSGQSHSAPLLPPCYSWPRSPGVIAWAVRSDDTAGCIQGRPNDPCYCPLARS